MGTATLTLLVAVEDMLLKGFEKETRQQEVSPLKRNSKEISCMLPLVTLTAI